MKYISKLFVVGILVFGMSGCSIWDAERGHDDDEPKVEIDEKTAREIQENLVDKKLEPKEESKE